MRPWAPLLAVGLLAACAEIEDVPEQGALPSSMDALVGGSGPDQFWQPATDLGVPRDRALPPPDLAPQDAAPGWTPDAGCRPNTRLAQCVICNANGVPERPVDDGTCPDFECGDALAYARRMDGDVEICVRIEREPQANHCAALGVCHSDAASFCGEPVETEVARADGPCAAFTGCEGLAAPQPQGAAGQPCNGVGTCQPDGTCSAPAGCERFADAHTLCGAGTENGQGYCDVFIQVGRTSCADYCPRWGGVCLQAWGERNDTCETNGGRGCGDNADDQICRCSLP